MAVTWAALARQLIGPKFGPLKTYLYERLESGAVGLGALTVTGAAVFNGAVTLGNAVADIIGIKGLLRIYNAAGTQYTQLTTGATATRAVAMPDQAGTVAVVTTAPTTAGQIVRASGVGVHTASTATYPDTAVQGDIVVATGANVLGSLTAATAGKILRAAGAGVVPAYSTATYPDSVAQGDLVVATAANVLGSLPDVAVGQVLASGGVGAAPAYTASPSLASLTLSTSLTLDDGAVAQIKGAGTGTGDVVQRYGATATEGLEIRVFDDVVSPAAVETNVLLVPANSVIYSVQSNIQAALTGGGTTVTASLGTAADPDKYGTMGDGGGDSLAQNAKSNWTETPTRLASAEQIVLTGCATGGAADGDTALTVGSVRVRVVYATCNALDNA